MGSLVLLYMLGLNINLLWLCSCTISRHCGGEIYYAPAALVFSERPLMGVPLTKCILQVNMFLPTGS